MRRRASTRYLAAIAAVAVMAGCSSDSQTATPSATTGDPAATNTSTEATTTTAVATTDPPATTAVVAEAPTTVAAAVATPEPASCPAAAPPQLTCFTVAVPADPAKPTGPTINLAVTVRRADPSAWTAPVLSEVGASPAFPWLGAPLASQFPGHDVIWVDVRGAGRSDGAVACPEAAKYPAELNSYLLGPEAAGVVKACLQQLTTGSVPVDTIFDHNVAASDLVAVRRALGVDAWSLFTRTGAADTGIRLVEIDSAAITGWIATSPEIVGTGDSPNTLAAAFAAFAADCSAVPSCAAAGQLDALATTALKRLTTPVTTKTIEASSGAPVVIDDIGVRAAIRTGMQSPGLAPAVPSLIAGLATGAADESLAGIFNGSGGDTSAILLTLPCQASDYAFPGLEHSASDKGGIFAGFSLKRWCDALGPVPQFTGAPKVVSEVPVLIVLPAYGLGSSEANAAAIFGGFPNTTIVAVPGIADAAVQLADCFSATATAFFAGPASPVDTSCLTSPATATLK